MFITKLNLNYTKTEITAYDIAEVIPSAISFYSILAKRTLFFPIFLNTVKSGRFTKKTNFAILAPYISLILSTAVDEGAVFTSAADWPCFFSENPTDEL